MGIQSLKAAFINGEYRAVTKGETDGVPEGVGLELLRQIRDGNIDRIKQRVLDSVGKQTYDETLKFAANSLLCEWAYVVDFDRNTFEVFEGCNRDQLDDSERFKFLEGATVDKEYKAVKLAARFPLDNLPSDKQFEAFFKEE